MAQINNQIVKNFTSLPNAVIQDDTIPDRARFLFVYMATKPNDWQFFQKPLCKGLGWSPDTLRKYMTELIDTGWVTHDGQSLESGKFTANQYTLHSAPCRKKPCRKKTVSEKNRHGKNPTLTKERPLQKKDGNVPASQFQKDPAGQPGNAGNTTKDINTEAGETQPQRHIEKEQIKENTNTKYEYTGKYPHSWSASSSEEYFWKEEVYENIMQDTKLRKVLDREAKGSDLYTPNEYVHELLDGWVKNEIKISPKLYGVEGLIKKHTEYMLGPFQTMPKAAPDEQIREAAAKIVAYQKEYWPWFGKTPHDEPIQDCADLEQEAIVQMVRSKKVALGDLQAAVILAGFAMHKGFGHFHDYVDGKAVYKKEIAEHTEANLEYAKGMAGKGGKWGAAAKEIASLLTKTGSNYRIF